MALVTLPKDLLNPVSPCLSGVLWEKGRCVQSPQRLSDKAEVRATEKAKGHQVTGRPCPRSLRVLYSLGS